MLRAWTRGGGGASRKQQRDIFYRSSAVLDEPFHSHVAKFRESIALEEIRRVLARYVKPQMLEDLHCSVRRWLARPSERSHPMVRRFFGDDHVVSGCSPAMLVVSRPAVLAPLRAAGSLKAVLAHRRSEALSAGGLRAAAGPNATTRRIR